MPYSKEELKKLRENLPTFLRKELQAESGLSAKTVRNILCGASENDDFVASAIMKADARKKLIDDSKSILSEL